MRKRGYNQAELIADGIGNITRLPVITDLIVRKRSNESQTHKQVYERYENVQDIFTLRESRQIADMHVLIVDDVITTGATLSSCAETLSRLPGMKVSFLGIAIAK